jgi:hypothetical protein
MATAKVQEALDLLEMDIDVHPDLTSQQRGGLKRRARVAARVKPTAQALALLSALRDELPVEVKPPKSSTKAKVAPKPAAKPAKVTVAAPVADDDEEEEEEEDVDDDDDDEEEEELNSSSKKANAAAKRRMQLKKHVKKWIGTPKAPCIKGRMFNLLFVNTQTSDTVWRDQISALETDENNDGAEWLERFHAAGKGQVPTALVGVEAGTLLLRRFAYRFLVRLVCLYLAHICWRDDGKSPLFDKGGRRSRRQVYIAKCRKVLLSTRQSSIARIVGLVTTDEMKAEGLVDRTVGGKSFRMGDDDDDDDAPPRRRRRQFVGRCFACNGRGHKQSQCPVAEQPYSGQQDDEEADVVAAPRATKKVAPKKTANKKRQRR